MSIKNTLNQIDDSVLTELFDMAQGALNDMDIVEMIHKETGKDKDRLYAISGLAVELANSTGQEPSIKTNDDLSALQAQIADARTECETL